MSLLSPSEALLLFSFLSSHGVPFLVGFIAKAQWHPQAKFALAVLTCVAMAFLSAYSAGKLDGMSITMSALIVLTASQAHFATWFKSLGFDERFDEDKLSNDRIRLMQ